MKLGEFFTNMYQRLTKKDTEGFGELDDITSQYTAEEETQTVETPLEEEVITGPIETAPIEETYTTGLSRTRKIIIGSVVGLGLTAAGFFGYKALHNNGEDTSATPLKDTTTVVIPPPITPIAPIENYTINLTLSHTVEHNDTIIAKDGDCLQHIVRDFYKLEGNDTIVSKTNEIAEFNAKKQGNEQFLKDACYVTNDGETVWKDDVDHQIGDILYKGDTIIFPGTKVVEENIVIEGVKKNPDGTFAHEGNNYTSTEDIVDEHMKSEGYTEDYNVEKTDLELITKTIAPFPTPTDSIDSLTTEPIIPDSATIEDSTMATTLYNKNVSGEEDFLSRIVTTYNQGRNGKAGIEQVIDSYDINESQAHTMLKEARAYAGIGEKYTIALAKNLEDSEVASAVHLYMNNTNAEAKELIKEETGIDLQNNGQLYALLDHAQKRFDVQTSVRKIGLTNEAQTNLRQIIEDNLEQEFMDAYNM